MKLSVIILSKNAEYQIENAIRSVSFADEIIVIDSGSTDKTIEIAKKAKVKIFNIKTEDFSKMRNLGLEKAQSEWVLYVDTDEVVSKELASSIIHSTSSGQEYQASSINSTQVAFRIKRKNFYLGSYEWPKIEKLERLFKKDALKGWYGELHESPKIEGLIGELDGFLLHYAHKDLSSMVKKTIQWSDVEAHLRYSTNHPKMSWWRFPRVMFSAFADSYIKKGGWKLGTAGLIESIYQSFSMFITYAKLWELQNKKESNKNKYE